MEPSNNKKAQKITANRIKIIDRIINAFKAKKLAAQSQQTQLDTNTAEALYYEDIKERMSKTYQKNKRQKKIKKLQQSLSHWKGLS